jgi:hypothetical protein
MNKADVCGLLCSLKGSPLSVLLAMWLLKYRLGEVSVGTSDLADYTGYAENTVRKGISRLHKLGLVVSLPQRYHAWTLTESAGQLMLPVTSNGDGEAQNLRVPKKFEQREAQNLSVDAQNLRVPSLHGHGHVHGMDGSNNNNDHDKEILEEEMFELGLDAKKAKSMLMEAGAYDHRAEKYIVDALRGGWSESEVLEELQWWLAYCESPRGRDVNRPWALAGKRISENKPVSDAVKQSVRQAQAEAEAMAQGVGVNAVEEEKSPAEVAWAGVKFELSLQMTRATFDTWIHPTKGISLEDGVMRVAVQNAQAVEWLTHRLGTVIDRTVKRMGVCEQVQYEIGGV